MYLLLFPRVQTSAGTYTRYNIKRRFWKIFQTHRSTLNSMATLIQSRWRSYRCRAVFTALRRSFLYLEAAARCVEHYWLVRSNREGKSPPPVQGGMCDEERRDPHILRTCLCAHEPLHMYCWFFFENTQGYVCPFSTSLWSQP